MNNGSFSIDMRELVPLITEKIGNGAEVKLTVRGGSMYPFLKNGVDKAIFVSPKGRKIRKGDIFLFERVDGSYAMHRVLKADDTLDFIGDAQWLAECRVSRDKLVAYVTAVERNGKRISCDRGAWRSAMTLYMTLRVKYPGFARAVYLFCCYFTRFLSEPGLLLRRIKRNHHKESRK